MAGSVRPMDIEEFYDADPRRRESAEIELGNEWTDATGLAYELNYIEDTGELYVMQEPPSSREWEDPFGGLHFPDEPNLVLQIGARVVAKIDSVNLLHQILDGWQKAMNEERSIDWVAERLRVAGVATTDA